MKLITAALLINASAVAAFAPQSRASFGIAKGQSNQSINQSIKLGNESINQLVGKSGNTIRYDTIRLLMKEKEGYTIYT